MVIRDRPYLGVGLNASSYLDEKRFENPSDMKDYLEIQSFGDAYEGARSLSVYEQMEEFKMCIRDRSYGYRSLFWDQGIT